MALSEGRNVPFSVSSFRAATLSDTSNVPPLLQTRPLQNSYCSKLRQEGCWPTEDERNAPVKQRNEKKRSNNSKQKSEQEKSSGVSARFFSLFLNVLLHQAIGVKRVEPCLNPTDRSSSLTADGNQ